MNENPFERDYLDGCFNLLEATFRAKLLDATRSVWSERLKVLNGRALVRTFRKICDNEDKLPSLACVLRTYRNMNPALDGAPNCRVGKDNNGVECWYWNDDPLTPAYRAQDCPEGRKFVAAFAKVAGKTPEEKR